MKNKHNDPYLRKNRTGYQAYDRIKWLLTAASKPTEHVVDCAKFAED